MIEQDMIIFRHVLPYDEILKGKDAVWNEGDQEVYASSRYLALRELNKQGYRVLQFLIDDNSVLCGEWVLVE